MRERERERKREKEREAEKRDIRSKREKRELYLS